MEEDLDGVFFDGCFLDADVLDVFPEAIAATTSDFSNVPKGPDASIDDASNPCSKINSFAAGLIFVKPTFLPPDLSTTL